MHYSLKCQVGTKETGPEYPQVSCLSQAYAHNMLYNEFPSFKPILNFELKKRAKLTDVLSQAAISAHGLLVNETVKNLFTNFNLMQHQFYPAIIQTNKGELQYYWMHLADRSFLNFIDFKQSEFYRTEYGFREEDLQINSYEDYIKKDAEIGKMSVIKSDFIKLKETFDPRLDLFVLPHFDATIYISQRLFESLSEQKITGIEMKEASTIA